MASRSIAGTPLRTTDPPFVWARQMRPVVDAVTAPAGAARALVVGNAGSGKSATLRHLHRLLVERDRDASLVSGESADSARVPRSHVLLVDDLHLMSREQVDVIRARAEDPDAALVVASRPWPASEARTAIARRLEQARPAIVLGHVSRSDVLDYLDGIDQVVPSGCIEHVLAITGGVSWLVSAALQAHDERDCADDPAHGELARALEEQIAHRLDSIDPALRRAIEELAVAPPGRAQALPRPTHGDDFVMHGHSEGLLMRNGRPVPLVRSAVQATIPVHRLIELGSELAEGLAHSAADGDTSYRDWVGLVHDPSVGEALAEHADRMLDSHPHRAAELYRGAVDSGVDPTELAGRRAQAAWASGDLGAAGALVDSASSQARALDGDRIADTSAAIWAARVMMEEAGAAYRATPPRSRESAVRAAIAALGVGSADGIAAVADDGAQSPTAPTALGVSMDLLRRGLAASLSEHSPESSLIDLVRAAEMYTSSRTAAPIPEPPAVIAAITALSLGDPATAHTVIEDAITGGHGGPWARTRLLLWRSWIAVQSGRPSEARDALAEARQSTTPRSPRDVLLARATLVAIARRYEDAAGLEAAWRHARASILRTDVDLYLLLPLSELISAAARVGDAARMRPHFERALGILGRLGEPPLWSAHLRWAGIQQGILVGDPASLKPHAQALVAASPRHAVAAQMAKAGRVWTAVLAGSVDADAVEAAARGLDAVGLAWDGARLAGHGASRSDDRKAAARLLACARELHPTDGVRKPLPAEADSGTRTVPEDVLSERELEVARLVLQGKTYAEIGEAIFISPRTVEHHIAHIRRRLGATSRSDVIAKLRVLVDESAVPDERATLEPGQADGPP